MYFVYILESEVDGSYYIGFTENINTRLNEHNFGRTEYTRLKRPWKLIYNEEFKTSSEALRREKYLKNLKSRVALRKIIESTGP